MRFEDLREWYSYYRHALIWNGPLELEPCLAKEEAMRLLKESKALMLRNVYDFDCAGPTSFWYVIKDGYDLSDYSSKTRKYIRKANDKFQIRRISFSRMLSQGYDVYIKAHKHYKTNDGFVLDYDGFVEELERLRDKCDFWGCIDRDTDILQAYSVCELNDGMCWFKYSRVNPEFLPKYYPMYGLYDARHSYYLKELGLRYVMTSARSITQHSEIQDFLIKKFGFRKAYCSLTIYYKPWIRYLIMLAFPFRKWFPSGKAKNLLAFEAINRGVS